MSDLRDRRIVAGGFEQCKSDVIGHLAREAKRLKHIAEYPHLDPHITSPHTQAGALKRVIRDIIKGLSIQDNMSAYAIRQADSNTKGE